MPGEIRLAINAQSARFAQRRRYAAPRRGAGRVARPSVKFSVLCRRALSITQQPDLVRRARDTCFLFSSPFPPRSSSTLRSSPRCRCRRSRLTVSRFWCSQGAELIRVSRFYKEGKEGKFVTFLHEDTRTLYESFRRGAKESSKCAQQSRRFRRGEFRYPFPSLPAFFFVRPSRGVAPAPDRSDHGRLRIDGPASTASLPGS